jgi:hypothetical protein
MALDLAVSRAITMVHILERALHDQGPWLLQLDGTLVAAERSVERDRVVFTGEFPAMRAAQDGSSSLLLYCGEDLVLARQIGRSGEEPFVTEWALSLPQGVAA